ncbi:hypothetical protein D3C77_513170 [compost metagenome]
MDFAIGLVLGLQVFAHVFRHQVAPVGRGVDQHVVARGRYGAVQHGLQRLVAGLAFFKRQVVAEHDEALGARGDEFNDVGQVAQVGLVDFDQAQAAFAIGRQHGLDQGAFAGAARAGHEHVVGRLVLKELHGVAVDGGLLAFDVLKVLHVDARHVAHRVQPATRATLAPTEGVRAPVDLGRGGRKKGLKLRQHPLGALDQGGKFGCGHVFILGWRGGGCCGLRLCCG